MSDTGLQENDSNISFFSEFQVFIDHSYQWPIVQAIKILIVNIDKTSCKKDVATSICIHSV